SVDHETTSRQEQAVSPCAASHVQCAAVLYLRHPVGKQFGWVVTFRVRPGTILLVPFESILVAQGRIAFAACRLQRLQYADPVTRLRAFMNQVQPAGRAGTFLRR